MTGPVTEEVAGAMTSAVTQTMTTRINEMAETMKNTVAGDSGTCCQDEVADAMLGSEGDDKDRGRNDRDIDGGIVNAGDERSVTDVMMEQVADAMMQ